MLAEESRVYYGTVYNRQIVDVSDLLYSLVTDRHLYLQQHTFFFVTAEISHAHNILQGTMHSVHVCTSTTLLLVVCIQ
jgi:hypothetical protein